MMSCMWSCVPVVRTGCGGFGVGGTEWSRVGRIKYLYIYMNTHGIRLGFGILFALKSAQSLGRTRITRSALSSGSWMA